MTRVIASRSRGRMKFVELKFLRETTSVLDQDGKKKSKIKEMKTDF